jgi:hypothetical protein
MNAVAAPEAPDHLAVRIHSRDVETERSEPDTVDDAKMRQADHPDEGTLHRDLMS